MIEYTKQKGKFVKHCPCTPDVVPCGYYNINLHTGCPFRCSYCILQAYLEKPEPVFFTNLDDLETELEDLARTRSHIRIGTGELSDSLALDPQTDYATRLLPIAEQFPQMVFEFKTKSTHIDNILNYETRLQNVVLAWSLNPQIIIQREERLTPDLNSRLNAIARAIKVGYKVALHFDPLVIFDGWETAYSELVQDISRIVPVSHIAWWSMGALRFPYEMRDHIFKHPQSRLFDGELVKSPDGKYRYFKPLRQNLFQFVSRQIKKYVSPHTPLYLCMENQEMWQEIFPEITATEEAVNRYLYDSATRPLQEEV